MNIKIIYGSTTGNTETVANLIANQMNHHSVELINAADATLEQVTGSDLVILGSSTWGYGEIQDDFQTFYDQMNHGTFHGKKVAIFGCGDSVSFSDVFCEAVNLIETKVVSLGADLVIESLKVDGDYSDQLEMIEIFAKSLAQ